MKKTMNRTEKRPDYVTIYMQLMEERMEAGIEGDQERWDKLHRACRRIEKKMTAEETARLEKAIEGAIMSGR